MWEVISQEQNPVAGWDGMIWLPSHHLYRTHLRHLYRAGVSRL